MCSRALLLSAWPTFTSGLPGHPENGNLIPHHTTPGRCEGSGMKMRRKWSWNESGGEKKSRQTRWIEERGADKRRDGERLMVE